jgi:hypothetical protein
MNLVAVAEEIQHRIIHIFGRDTEGRRATNGGNSKLDYDPHFRDYVWFYEVRRCSSQMFLIYVGNTVLPCRHWERFRRLAPDWLVRFGCVSYLAKRRGLQVTKDT